MTSRRSDEVDVTTERRARCHDGDVMTEVLRAEWRGRRRDGDNVTEHWSSEVATATERWSVEVDVVLGWRGHRAVTEAP